MKKTLKFSITLLIIIGILISVISVNASEQVKVKIDNNEISFDVPPQLIGGRTMVPLRAIFEALGATVQWDDSTQTVVAYNEVSIVKATINNNIMTVNNIEKTMDVAPMLVDGRTLVPARFVAEAFNCGVNWNADEWTVYITTTPIDYSNVEKDISNVPDNTINSAANVNIPQNTNNTVLLNEYSFDPTLTLIIFNTEFIRGNEANNIIKSENQFNDEPSANQEWIILSFDVNYISSSDGINDELSASDVIYKDTFFTEAGNSIPVYDLATLGDRYGAYGVFRVKMYPGSSSKIVIGLLTDKNIGNIKLKVPNKRDNTVTWIPCISGSTSYSAATENKTHSSNNTSYQGEQYYPGTSAPTYTSVTGVALKKIASSDIHIYDYDYNNCTKYWDELIARGWYIYSKKSDSDSLTVHFAKGSEMITVCSQISFNEVWILY